MGSDAAFRASCMTQHQQAMALAFPWQQHHQWLNSRYEQTHHNLQQQQQQQNQQQQHQNAQQNHQQHQNEQQNHQHQNGQQNPQHENGQQNHEKHQNGQQTHHQLQNEQQNHQQHQNEQQNHQQHQNEQQNHQQHQNGQQNHHQHQNGQQNQQQQSHQPNHQPHQPHNQQTHQQQSHQQQQNRQHQIHQQIHKQNQQQQQQNHQQQQQNHQQQQQNNQQQSQQQPTPQQQRQTEQPSQPPPLIQLPPPPPPKRYLIAGKSCGKEIVPVEKKDENELWSNVEAQAAFLGPNLWEKTLPYDADLKYVDLDEFLSENGIPVENGGVGGGMAAGAQPAPGGGNQPGGLKQLPGAAVTDPSGGRISPSGSNSQHSLMLQTKRERSPSPSEPMSPLNISPPSPADSTLSFASSSRDFDPRTRAFSDEELKPQPMVKKSRKQVRSATFVPDGLKDEKYWARRRKNNMAAKRSRDARRLKENQIALRAGFLEKENLGLRQEMERLKKENLALRDRLSEFTDI